MHHRPTFELAITRALVVGLVLTLASVVVLFIASFSPPGPWTNAVSNLASATLSIGVIATVYDVFIRGSFANEMLDAVHVSGSLRTSGILEVTRETDVAWQDTLVGGREFHVLLVEPTAWVEREWPHLLAAGRLRQVRVHVYLPDTDGESLPMIARQLRLSPEDFKNRIATNTQLIEEGWKNADPALLKSSSIDIRLYDAIPAYGLIIVDQMILLLMQACLGKSPGDVALTLAFRDQYNGYPSGWLRAQTRSFEQLPLAYSNEVE